MDLASVVAALASVGVRVSGSNPNNNIQEDSSRACPTGLAGPEPSGTHIDPGQHFHTRHVRQTLYMIRKRPRETTGTMQWEIPLQPRPKRQKTHRDPSGWKIPMTTPTSTGNHGGPTLS